MLADTQASEQLMAIYQAARHKSEYAVMIAQLTKERAKGPAEGDEAALDERSRLHRPTLSPSVTTMRVAE